MLQQPRPENRTLTDAGNVAGAIAHELRQPLSTIHLLASHLKANLAKSDTVNPEILSMLEQQAELAGQILSNLVSFARSGEPQKAPADINHILRTVIGRISWRPEIRLVQKLARRLPRANADPIHVDRIISNLISNALESMEVQGTLSIKTRL